MSLPVNPWFSLHSGTNVPYLALARHMSAVVFYLAAFVQWPAISPVSCNLGHVVSEWAGEDRVFAYNLTSLMFTLAFWCACLFHYLVSAGRVEVDWSSGKVCAKGWIVKTSRRAHRVLLSLALAISAMTIIQSTTTAMVITHFYLSEDEPNAKEHTILILLKFDQTLAFFMFVYVLGRLVFEPVGIRKPRQPRNFSNLQSGNETVTPNPESFPIVKIEIPESCEECSICVEKWANRQLQCGHTICCCCLVEIWKTGGYSIPLCPFCRMEANSIKMIKLIDGGLVNVSDCCGGTVSIPENTSTSS